MTVTKSKPKSTPKKKVVDIPTSIILTDDQIKDLADRINAKLDIPWIGERLEFHVYKFGIKIVLAQVEKHIPEEWVEFLKNAAQGFTADESANFAQGVGEMASFINKKVDIPFLSEKKEQALIYAILTVIFESMREGVSLTTKTVTD